MVIIDILHPCDMDIDAIKPHLKTMFDAFREAEPHLTITSIKVTVDEVK